MERKGANMTRIEKLRDAAAELNPLDRLKLVDEILATLDKPDPEIMAQWAQESERRYEAYKNAKTDAADWNSVRRKYDL
jgi:putative addiction module component (TIGR02574 family)